MPAGLKRKATDEPQCPSARPRGHSRPQPTTRWSIEPNSIDSIIRNNSRDRLYVPPVAWTSKHLQHLNCGFILQKGQIKERRESQADPPVHDLRKPNMPSGLRRTSLACRPSADVTDSHSHEHLSFYFRRQPAATVWTEGVFSRNCAGPSLAYVTFDGIQARRSKYVHNSPGKTFNEPVFRTCDKKLRSLQPANTVEDPYIMGILIALAQEQWRHRQRNEDTQPTAHLRRPPRLPVVAQTEALMTVASVSGFHLCRVPQKIRRTVALFTELPGCGGIPSYQSSIPYKVVEQATPSTLC
ncbi:hypothetical protein ASPBRDRAFT_57159 [Aspergillus brasiliensis CBS 101740]|uniref:Uncharacterized protein n=1 Tax=Aspergillus brasiliensis (strain CBS 101740 / IMI 381727 / IBT 21946) TaxID=767769 RepID=A0A1L9UCT8_ASPBC|nr:hypothetical protein ASPBRDRAFT_57159 [Aspergillus brasiliensis CBS 101740]